MDDDLTRLESFANRALLLPVIGHHFANKNRGVKVKLVRITIQRRRVDGDIAGSYAFFTAYRSQHLARLPVEQILLKILVSLG